MRSSITWWADNPWEGPSAARRCQSDEEKKTMNQQNNTPKTEIPHIEPRGMPVSVERLDGQGCKVSPAEQHRRSVSQTEPAVREESGRRPMIMRRPSGVSRGCISRGVLSSFRERCRSGSAFPKKKKLPCSRVLAGKRRIDR